MEAESSAVFDWLMNALVWYSAPVAATVVSVIYFLCSKADASLSRRLVTSAHGLVIATLYVLAMSVAITRRSDPAFGAPFTIMLLLPVVLIVVSVLLYRGGKELHWLQLLNVACLAWTGFVGGMAVTGDWL
jgi:hypothetical protein